MVEQRCTKLYHHILLISFLVQSNVDLSGLVSSVRRALTAKLRRADFKPWLDTLGGLVTIIMWGCKLNSNSRCIYSTNFTYNIILSVIKLALSSDRYLTFNHHVSDLCRKAARQVNCLMQLSTMLPVESKLTVFNAFIVYNFLYCSVV